MPYVTPTAQDLALRVDRRLDLPLGAQLASALRERIRTRRLSAGDRLPSVRDLATEAGVNVNTVRAVYGKLENEGLIRSEHGRGTFVAGADMVTAPRDEAATRRELRRQIAALEAELVRRVEPAELRRPARRANGGTLPTTEELTQIRDDLHDRLRELDTARAEVLRRLAELDRAEADFREPEAPPRSTLSLRGARVRWVGA